MSLVGGLLAGGAIGLTHALEADHLAAVATLVEDDEPRSAAAVGASWGVGHAVPVVGLGSLFLGLGIGMPPALTVAVEAVVGVVLIALGLRLLAVAGGKFTTHRHGAGDHRHLTLGEWSLGLTHAHVHGEAAVVGVLHGIAGSGALVVALVASSPTATGAVSLLAGFVALSIATMAAVSLVWGRGLGTALERPLRATAGLVGVAVGVAILAG